MLAYNNLSVSVKEKMFRITFGKETFEIKYLPNFLSGYLKKEKNSEGKIISSFFTILFWALCTVPSI